MKDFKLPEKLTDLEVESDSHFHVVDQIDLESYDPNSCIDLLENFSSETIHSRCFELITDQANFDIVYSFVKYFDSLAENVKAAFVERLLKGGRGFIVSSINKSVPVEKSVVMKNALFIYIYFISLLIPKIDGFVDSLVDKEQLALEKGRKKRRRVISSEYSWNDYLYDGIEIMLFTLRGNLKSFFNMGVPDDIFLQLFTTPCVSILEKPANTENSRLIEVTVNTLASLLSTYPQTVSVMAGLSVSLLSTHEHMCDILTNLCSILYSRCNQNTELLHELIVEIAKQNFSESTKTTALVKNLSHFITCTSEQCPFALLRFLPLLLKLLDRESYTLRLAIIQSLGNLIEKTSQRATAEKAKANEHTYQSVMRKRASIVIRRQSVAASANETAEAGEEGEPVLREINLQTALQIINLIGERQHDVNAFVRSASLRVLNTLCVNGFIPLSQYVTITAIALERLQDKAVLVRKNAMNLLTVLLENNPYEAQFDSELYKRKIQELEELVSSFTQQDPTTGEVTALTDQEEEERKKVLTLLDYYQNALQFTTSISNTIPQVCKLLLSKSDGDVVSALQFFPLANSFNIKGIEFGLRRMLLLVWNQSPAIAKELIETVKYLYFCTPKEDEFYPANQITSNLIRLIQGATLAEATSFAELVPHLIGENLINAANIEGLWAYVHSSQVPASNKSTALYILSMIAAASPALIYRVPSRLLALKQFVANEDLYSMKYVFAIWSASSSVLAPEEKKAIVHTIRQYILHSTLQCETPILKKWFEVANAGIDALFRLTARFDKMVTLIVQQAVQQLFTPTDSHNETPSEEVSEGVEIQKVNESCLTRFFFILGPMSLKLLQYVEETAIRAKKARHRFEENKQKEKRGKSKADSEMHLISQADDYEDMLLESINKKGIVIGDLLSMFSNPLKEIILNKEGVYGASLQGVALLTFCKFMTISKTYCEENINLLFTILVRSQDEHTRSNIMICIGDLCYRFPNQLEQWTNRIYSILRDESVLVRTNALSVLSHLILNDMIRVKGQISLLVLLLEDPSEHIQTLAKVFFNEWGKRGNSPVYNVLPECISSLLEMPEMTYEKFGRLVKYLMHFVDKDKQQEQLIDKICQRILTTKDVFKWKCLVFCLSCLSNTNATLSKYLLNKRNLKDALRAKEVADLFWGIFNKIKRTAKPEQQGQIAELQTFIEECSSTKHEGSAPTTPIKEPRDEPMPVLESRLSSQKRSQHMELHASGKKKQRMKALAFSDEDSEENVPVAPLHLSDSDSE